MKWPIVAIQKISLPGPGCLLWWIFMNLGAAARAGRCITNVYSCVESGACVCVCLCVFSLFPQGLCENRETNDDACIAVRTVVTHRWGRRDTELWGRRSLRCKHREDHEEVGGGGAQSSYSLYSIRLSIHPTAGRMSLGGRGGWEKVIKQQQKEWKRMVEREREISNAWGRRVEERGRNRGRINEVGKPSPGLHTERGLWGDMGTSCWATQSTTAPWQTWANWERERLKKVYCISNDLKGL